ncbi:f-box-like domain-containing protein [Ditylenchus destructor]|nr:f-box-like domain-containing protein [Ditylenchus destructor]
MSGYNLRKRPAPVTPNHKTIAKVAKCEVNDSRNINMLPDEILVQIFEKLRWQKRLKIEQVCKKWQHVGKNLSWSNERTFDNESFVDLPEARVMQIRPFFDRCGSHLRHLTLRNWLPHVALPVISMAQNVQHLRLCSINLTSEHFQQLAQILPNLKSLEFALASQPNRNMTDFSLGLMEYFKVMTSLEYLYIEALSGFFHQYEFVQFPPNLKYLCLDDVKNVEQILSLAAKGCKDLKGLSVVLSNFNIDGNAVQSISQMKSLTYLSVPMRLIAYNDVFEPSIELRALKIDTINTTTIEAITRHCKNLEHLHIYRNRWGEIMPVEHANMLRLASLPNLCSLEIWASNYSKEQTTEFVNRLVDTGNLQYIQMTTSKAPLELEVLFEILRRCKGIRSIALNFGRIDAKVYSKICGVIDEIDESDRQHGEFLEETHPIVEVQCNTHLIQNIATTYKWLRFKDQVSYSAVLEKWQYGSLSAGKP